jgi:hypothetical protein
MIDRRRVIAKQHAALLDAASVLDDLAAGITPTRARVNAAALALNARIRFSPPSFDILDAAMHLNFLTTRDSLDPDKAGRLCARAFAEDVRTVAAQMTRP